MERGLAGLCVMAVAAWGGCAPGPATGDAATDAGAAADGGVQPVPPASPVLTPCPAGWREVVGADGVTTCDPWPATGYRDDCAFDEAHFPGTPDCARIGTSCASDGWPADLPSGATVVYVDDDAAPGGDGTTRARAFTSIAPAVAVAPSGAVIAVATGHYDGPEIAVTAGRTLWGACVSGTRLTTSTYVLNAAVVRLVAAGAAARNFGVDTPTVEGVVLDGADVSLTDVVVSGAVTFGMVARSGTATVSHVVVRDSRPTASMMNGDGLLLRNAAHVVADHLVLERNVATGAIAGGAGTRLELSDGAIEGTLPDAASGNFGRGLDFETGTTLVATRVAVERNHDVALEARGAGATVQAVDLVVRDTLPGGGGGTGLGLESAAGATVTVQRAWLEANHQVGFFCDAAALEVDDAIVRDTLPTTSTGRDGEGIGVKGAGASVVLARVTLSDNLYVGLIAQGSVAVHASDLVVSATGPRMSDGAGGAGLDAESGADVTLARALFDHDALAAVFASGDGTVVRASDVLVRDTQRDATGEPGGIGFLEQLGAHVEVTTARIERSHFVGALALHGGELLLTDVVVSGVASSGCETTTCPMYAGGHGLSAHYGATLTATRFTVEGVALCGVTVGESTGAATSVDLSDGVITGAPIGACVQVDGYDTARLSNHVEYRDVGVPLQATTYSIPDARPYP